MPKNACNTGFVKIGSSRELASLKSVLKDPSSSGPDPVYWVFNDVGNEKWANLTIITPGSFNGEYPKTFGHYHPTGVPDETYHLIGGEGILVMQKKHFENGSWIPEMVDEVYLIKTKPGEEIVITPEFGHSWSNTGVEPLISYDNWRSGHQPSDYEPIEKLQGMAYYLVEKNGEVEAVPNPNYRDLPKPKWVTAKELSGRDGAF